MYLILLKHLRVFDNLGLRRTIGMQYYIYVTVDCNTYFLHFFAVVYLIVMTYFN